MSSPRFFYEKPLHANSRVLLSERIAHHALRVLRLKPQAAITLFDGQGGQYAATLCPEGARAWAQVGSVSHPERELRGSMILLQGLAAGDKMDWIVEKAVELGICALYPVTTERSVLRLEGARQDKRLARWREIVRGASEQCGRNHLMTVHSPMTWSHCLDGVAAPILVCDPEGTQDLPEALTSVTDRVCLAVGPEGGWSPEELAATQRHRLSTVRFGPRVLRSETAGLALAAAASALLRW